MEGKFSRETKEERVENDLKTVNIALLGSQSKMDSSPRADQHVSHFIGQTKLLISVSFLVRDVKIMLPRLQVYINLSQTTMWPCKETVITAKESYFILQIPVIHSTLSSLK